MSGYDLIIFDLDGTLIDSGGDLVRCMEFMLAERGYPRKDPKALKGNIGWGVRKFVSASIPPVSETELDAAEQHFRRIYAEHMLDTTGLFPGIRELLDGLERQNILMAVFTNKADNFSRELIKQLGIERYFAMVLGRDSVTQPKPHPEGVHRILQAAGIAANRTLYAGDSALDIECGRNAGVVTCGVTYGGILPVERMLAAQPDFVVSDPLEILGLTADGAPPASGK